MSTRPVFSPDRFSEAASKEITDFHAGVVSEVKAAIADNDVVVVGMAQNPFVKGVRKALDGAGIPFKYLEYGSYLSQWKPRLAIKIWTGWPTFPQVFVKGEFIGGDALTKAAIADGSLKAKLEKK